MYQIENNSPEQELLRDFAVAVDGTVVSSQEVHQKQMAQYINNSEVAQSFSEWSSTMLLAKGT